MKLNFFTSAIILAFLFSACSSQPAPDNTVVLRDKIVNEDNIGAEERELVSREQSSTTENSTTNGSDNSEISAMTDGFGNRIETRTFKDNDRLAMIVLQTKKDGNREAFVYGQSGEKKPLPAVFIDRAFNADSSELADAAGIFGTKPQKPDAYIAKNTMPEDAALGQFSRPASKAALDEETKTLKAEEQKIEVQKPAEAKPIVQSMPVDRSRAFQKEINQLIYTERRKNN